MDRTTTHYPLSLLPEAIQGLQEKELNQVDFKYDAANLRDLIIFYNEKSKEYMIFFVE